MVGGEWWVMGGRFGIRRRGSEKKKIENISIRIRNVR